jgi:hypothetical protein
MSTRACIARLTGRHPLAFEGRYHHWDGYPSGLGHALYHAYGGPFDGDLERMLRVLIDEHPAGWSTIVGADWSLPPGFIEDPATRHDNADRDVQPPLCYCHGDRHEEPHLLTHADAAGCGVEYTYAFDRSPRVGHPRMTILSSRGRDGSKMIGFAGYGDPESTWHVVARVRLDAPEPDWGRLDFWGRHATRAPRPGEEG